MISLTETLQRRFDGQSPAALLFDLDGTLVDSVPDLAVAVDATLQALDVPLAGEPRVRQWVGNGALRLMQRALAFALGVDESQLSEGAVGQAHQLFLQHYQRSNGVASRVYPTVIESLQRWQQQQRPMAVVTNKPLQFVPALLAQQKLAEYFSVLVGGECTPHKKPSPQPLLYACEQLLVDPTQCLMIGDSSNDVLAARAAGMPVVAVSYGYNHGEPIAAAKPDWVVDRFAAIALP